MADLGMFFQYLRLAPLFTLLVIFFIAKPSFVRAAQDQRALLQLIVNQAERGDVLVLIRDKDILARVSDLERAGLRGFSGRRETVRGETYVSLSSLAPDISFELDEKSLALRLTARPALLGTNVLDLRQERPAGIVYAQDPSAFVNYSVNWQQFKDYEAFGEAGFSMNGNLLLSGISRNMDGSTIRGLTNLTIDERQSLRRWVAGDSFASSSGLGGSLFLGGLSLSRDFSLDPYFYRYPALGLSEAILTPSTVDIYVNGLLVRRERLPPGQFELKNLPVSTGSGVTRVVIRDAFGREREVVSPFYFTTGVLAQGLHEYSYNLGYRRNNLGTDSWDYGPLAFLGRHRLGLTDTLTSGLRLEASSGLFSAGPVATVRLSLGEIELSTAASHDAGQNGGAASLGYSYLGRPLSLGGSIRTLSPHYATLSLKAADERPWLETNAFAGLVVGPGISLSLQHTFQNSQASGRSQRLSLTVSSRLIDYVSLFIVGSHARETEGHVNEIFVGLSFFLGDNTGSVSYQQRADVGTKAAELQKSLPVGSGFGYRLQASQNRDQEQVAGLLQYQGPYGRYEASYSEINGEGNTVLGVSGGLAAVGKGVYLTRPVQEGFALIRVPGVAGVRGYANNQEVGSTDSQGNLLIPELLAYYGNRLSIADQDIPLDRAVGATEKTVAPPFRGGAVVTFPVERIQSVTGALVVELAGQRIVPAFGQLTVTADGKRLESPIGRQGEFYLENVSPGSHAALLEYKETACQFILEVPASDAPVIKLGTLRCVVP
ncbi:MAG: fimbrial biogenesis outer membrane usher protein [Deltaproteobacteria bacterium]|nr:fimbrial biogenesis outer membrane usher protein [Deltaproteobacteria bacterium]